MKRILVLLCFFFFCLNTRLAAEEKWKEYNSRHFVIYYNNAPMDFIKNVEFAAENLYGEITKELGFTRYQSWTWDERANIYIYDSYENYVDSLYTYRWSHGIALAKTKTIKTFPTAHGFFDSTLPHELGHIIFREFIGSQIFLPLWFEEGVAMYQEKARRWGANEIVKNSIANKTFMELNELNTISLSQKTDPDKVRLFYAESASLVYYLITELGKYRFVNFCRELKEGVPFELALRKVYFRFKNLEDLNKAWIQYLEDE